MNKKFLIAIPLIVCVALSTFVALRFVRAQVTDAFVWVSPDILDVNVCEYFLIDVMINVTEPPVADYEFALVYDASLMTPVNAWDGGFLAPLVNFNWDIWPDHGGPGLDAVHCWANTLTVPPVGNTGHGTLSTIEFHCDAPGGSALTLDEVTLSDPNGIYYPVPPTQLGHGWVNQIVPPANTWIDPPDYTVPICTPFPVYVMVDIPPTEDLYSFSLVLTYNTAYVDCLDIVDGGFLPPPTMVTHKLIDDALGRIEFDLTSMAPGSGSSGTGSIAKILFHCTGGGLSILTLDTVLLYDSAGIQIPTSTADGRVVQIGYWEPLKLQHLVELPYPYFLSDVPFVPPGTPEGYVEIKAELEAKGYLFDPGYGGSTFHVDSFFDVTFEVGGEYGEFMTGNATSWWSSNTLEDGTRACMLVAEMDDGTSMVMGFVTNLLPPEQVPDVDPYIIVNAQPYLFVRFYWWAWYPIGKIVTWSYWWYDSHSHPNWFWKPYWWWRVYTRSYYYPYTVVPYWRPWWSWWWHWVYWHHWHWWCTYFPYDP